MNIIAGIVIGILAGSWASAFKFTCYWAVFHVLYGAVFGLHKNPVVETSHGGKPILSYYIARFFTGFITSLVIALVVLFLVRLLNG